MICHFITFLPFILILINLFKFISNIRMSFIIIGLFSSIILIALLILNSMIVSLLYKEESRNCNETVKDFFENFSFKGSFCYLVFNYLNLAIILFVTILLFIFRNI